MKEKIKELRLQHATYDLKAIISKTILTPIITHLANTYYFPKPKQELVNTIIVQYAVGFVNSVLNTKKLSKPKKDGGYDFADISTYACLTYVKHITPYIRAKINNEKLPPHLRHFEYNIGLQISNILQIPRTQSTPHAALPSPYYKQFLKIIEEYKTTKEELIKGKINEIYKRLKSIPKIRKEISYNPLKITTPIWSGFTIPYCRLPNYLKTFNYKLLNNLLPLESKFKPNIIDLKPNCHICLTQYETDIHLFSKCVIIKPLLHHVTRLYFNFTGQHTTYFFDTARIQFHTPLSRTTYCNNLTPYLNSVLSYTIWKTRNKNKFQTSPIKPHTLIIRFNKSLHYRQRYYEKYDKQLYLDLIKKIVQKLPSVQR